MFDGGALVHTLSTASIFVDYAHKVFIQFLLGELQKGKGMGVMWDSYFPNSLKHCTREKRGSGVRFSVFLRDSQSKEELFALLSQEVAEEMFPQGKELYITAGTSVITRGSDQLMGDCTHEEADTRIVVHLLHALQTDAKRIVVRTVDTDIIVILIGQFFRLIQCFPEMDLWVAFGVGKGFSYYSINNMCYKLGKDCHLLCCYSTPSVVVTPRHPSSRRAKRVPGRPGKCYPQAEAAFIFIHENPYEPVSSSTPHFQHLERLTVIMYDKKSVSTSVNETRRELFMKQIKSLENLPPTQVSLCCHSKTYYAGFNLEKLPNVCVQSLVMKISSSNCTLHYSST